MKKEIYALVALFWSGALVLAVPFMQFPGWDRVKDLSTDITVMKCISTTDNPDHVSRDLISSKIQTVMALKGRTNLVMSSLRSMYWPHAGEYYLVFASYHDGSYQATEPYRLVPLGTFVPPDLLAGKALDDNLRIIFRWRLNKLESQMKEEEGEKQRLIAGLTASNSHQ